jgi:hypothetical protein
LPQQIESHPSAYRLGDESSAERMFVTAVLHLLGPEADGARDVDPIMVGLTVEVKLARWYRYELIVDIQLFSLISSPQLDVKFVIINDRNQIITENWINTQR